MKYLFRCYLALFLIGTGCQAENLDSQTELPLLEERTDVWNAADDVGAIKFQERVFWAESSYFDKVGFTDGVVRARRTHSFSALRVGDVIVSNWNHGTWRKVVRRDQGSTVVELETRPATIGDILVEGRLVAVPQQTDVNVAPAGLSACVGSKCSAELNFRSTNADALNWSEPLGGVQLRATDFDFEFKPVFRYEEGVDRRKGAFSRMRVTGDLELGARFDVEAERASSSRASFPLLGAGSDGTVISWNSERDPATDLPEEPRVSEFYMLDQLAKIPSLTSEIVEDEFVVAGPENAFALTFQPYDDVDPLFPVGGIELEEFVTRFNEAFAGTEFRARYVIGSGGFSANVFVYTQDVENVVSFVLLGRQIDAHPQMDIAQSVNVPTPGRIITTARVDARVDGGWVCYERTGCEFDGAGMLPTSTGSMTSQIIDGEPWVDMGIGLRPTVVVRRGASPYSNIAAGVVKIRNQVQTDPPFCATEQSIDLEYEVRRLSRRIYHPADSLYADKGHSPELEGCTGDGSAPLDCSVCEVEGDRSCIEDVCGPDSDCYLGRCTIEAPFDVGLTWTASEPPVDLDLWVELSDGRVVHPGNLQAGPATHANQSDGGVSSQARSSFTGVCKGDLDRMCEAVDPSGGSCPSQCNLVSEQPGFCHAETISCTKWLNEFGTCPAECRSTCVVGVDDDCILPCSGDDCYACRGRASIDYTGCVSNDTASACNQTENCTWQESGGSRCTGGRVRCYSLSEDECDMEPQCGWTSSEREIEFPPFVERVAFGRLVDQAIEIWVVNQTESDREEPIAFELSIRLRDNEEKVIQGFVGTEPGDMSLRYRYQVEGL